MAAKPLAVARHVLDTARRLERAAAMLLKPALFKTGLIGR
ncbi:hypothetical protein BSIN_0322 [Burkholderia singularis]|uniref:Uncharacterized protein n=1 Tax=Burkholderia singularis TaxID=1503053 RepID=A0A238H524_9BURK|nr:hypothetical protein BSIN_0322 [Burkholderia singularis]